MKITMIPPPEEEKVVNISSVCVGSLFRCTGSGHICMMSGYNEITKSYDYYDLIDNIHRVTSIQTEVIPCDGELKYWEVKP